MKNSKITEAALSSASKVKERTINKLIEAFQLQTKTFNDIQTDPDAFCVWFHRYSRHLSRSSFLSYRKWLCSYLKANGHENAEGLVRSVKWAPEPEKVIKTKLEQINEGERKVSRLNNDKGLVTSELTASEIGYLHNLAISTKHDGSPRYRMGLLTSLVFESTSMTGLRMSEWCNAKAISGLDESGMRYERVLEVETSLKGTGRVGGEPIRRKRYLICDHFSDQEWGKIEATLKSFEIIKSGYDSLSHDQDADEDDKDLSDYYRIVIFKPMALTLKYICRRLFEGEEAEQRVTPYTARHLYASEFRRARMGNKIDLAAAMGHTDLVNQRYYGDFEETDEARRFTWSLAKPHPVNIEAVTVRVKDRTERAMERLRKSLRARGSNATIGGSPLYSGSDFDFDV